MSDPPPPAAPPKFGLWIFLTVLVLVVGILTAYLTPLFKAADVIEKTAETTIALIDALRPEINESNFTQWRDLSVKPTKGNLLEIATAEATESFSRTKNVKLFDRVVPGSTSVFEIVVPATYRFHIDLDDEWNVTTDGKRVVVRAPKVRPTLPVAFDTARVEKMTTAGWARWDLDTDLAELEKGVTEQLATRASDPATIAKIEDEGRLAVARFVRNWLLSRQSWGDGRFEEIVVIFEGEEEVADVLPPMLRIEQTEPVLP